MTNDERPTIEGWNELSFKGGKRTHIEHSETLPDWFVGWGKDRSCQFEGKWSHMMVIAAKILASDNSRKVVENVDDWPDEMHQPGLEETVEEIYQRTGTPYDFEEDGETEDTHYPTGGWY